MLQCGSLEKSHWTPSDTWNQGVDWQFAIVLLANLAGQILLTEHVQQGAPPVGGRNDHVGPVDLVIVQAQTHRFAVLDHYLFDLRLVMDLPAQLKIVLLDGAGEL